MKKFLLFLIILTNATIAFSYDYCPEISNELNRRSERIVGGPTFYIINALSRVSDCQCTDLANDCSFKVSFNTRAHGEGGHPARPLYILEMRKNIIHRAMERRVRRYLRRAKSECQSMGLSTTMIEGDLICSTADNE